jgi:phosphoribosyl-AMP cyclohydrolase / phosphoribosyl-ATP pyrophosphohydrolase
MPEFNVDQVDFSKLQDPQSGEFVVPAILSTGGKIAMVGFMNREALDRTLTEGLVTFFSRSTGKLWTKGETSGNFLRFVGAVVDCDFDTLLIEAKADGPVCHRGTATCFEEMIE